MNSPPQSTYMDITTYNDTADVGDMKASPSYRVERKTSSGKAPSSSSFSSSFIPEDGNLKKISFSEILKQSRMRKDYSEALEIVELVLAQDVKDLSQAAFTGVIQIFGETNQLGRAILVLKYMKEKNVPINERHYGAVIQACRRSGQWEMALGLFERMEKEKPVVQKNTIIYNQMISILGDAKQLGQVLNLYDRMTEDEVPKDSVTFTVAITACEKAGDWKTAIKMYKDMEQVYSLQPNLITLNAVLNACAHNRRWQEALEIFENAGKKGVARDAISYSTVIAVCGECHRYDISKKVFDSMDGYNATETINWNSKSSKIILKDRVKRDTGTYNAMITACEKNGKLQDALYLIDTISINANTDASLSQNSKYMSKYNKYSNQRDSELFHDVVRPDSKTYCAAISCCGNAGQWREALRLFNKMDDDGIEKDAIVYNSIINVLQAASYTLKLEEVLTKMGYNDQTDSIVSTLTGSGISINGYGSSAAKSKERQLMMQKQFELNFIRPEDILNFRGATKRKNAVAVTSDSLFARSLHVYSQGVTGGVLRHWLPDSEIKKYELDNQVSTAEGGASKKSGSMKGRPKKRDSSIARAGSIPSIAKIKAMDLHGFPLSVAKVAIEYVLREIRQDFIDYDYDLSSQNIIYELHIITGRGRHINSSGTRGVLKAEIETFLTHHVEPTGHLRIHRNLHNEGVIIIKRENIIDWLIASITK